MTALLRASRYYGPLLFTLLYIAFEFSFNYQLLDITGPMVTEETLQGLEFWGRVLSGIGFGFTMHRWVQRYFENTTLSLIICFALGITSMWHLQKEVTDHLVAQASLEDKKVALVLGQLAQKAAQGELSTLQARPLFTDDIGQEDRKIVESLFPAMALFVPNRIAQLAAWQGVPEIQMTAYLASDIPAQHLDNAYRNLIVPPLTLGISLFFALLNLAQLISSIISPWIWGVQASYKRFAVSIALFGLLLTYSFAGHNPFVHSQAYQQDFRKTLWQEDRTLAVLTEWSSYGVPSWYPLAHWCNQYVLRDVKLRRPY